MSTPEQLKNEILELLKSEVKDLWEEEDETFLAGLANDMAHQKLLAVASPNPQEHQRNLQHLAATLQGEIARKRLKLNNTGKEVFHRVVGMAIRTVAVSALGVVGTDAQHPA